MYAQICSRFHLWPYHKSSENSTINIVIDSTLHGYTDWQTDFSYTEDMFFSFGKEFTDKEDLKKSVWEWQQYCI